MNSKLFAGIVLVSCGVFATPEVSAQSSDLDPALRLAPEEGGVRRWQGAPGEMITLYEAPSLDASVILELDAGSIFRNLGCSLAAEQSWCEVQPFPKGATSYVPAEALIPVAGPDGVIARGIDDSRDRAKRRKFDASAQVACAQEVGQDLATCEASVARSPGGDATISATFWNGFSRLLFFEHGAFLRANTTMSGVGTDTDWRVADDTYFIRVDDQRFEIPVEFVFGN